MLYSCGGNGDKPAETSSSGVDSSQTKGRTPIASVVSNVIVKNGLDSGLAVYRYLKLHDSTEYDFGVEQLNVLGFQGLKEHEAASSIRIFQLNTEQYPNSAGAFYGLGSAYIANGERAAAAAALKRSVTLDSSNQRAKTLLDRVTAMKDAPGTYICRACGCKNDGKTFAVAGKCDACQMELIHKPLFELPDQP
jgi:predicted Zn-ribbon and HTH transcriptional regulator